MDERLIFELKNRIQAEEILLSADSTAIQTVYMGEDAGVISHRKMLGPEKLITGRLHPRFVHFPEHRHDFVEIVYMCRGSTTHIINDTGIVLQQGELLFLSQNSRQEILPAGENDLMVNFIVRPRFFDGTLDFLGSEETPLRRFIVNCLCGKADSDFLLFRVAELRQVQNLVENLLWALVTDTANRRSTDQLTMGLLFTHLLGAADRISAATKGQTMVVKVLQYVEENYVSGSLACIAEQLHYDTAWLSREVKRRTGKNFTELLQEKRMSQAAWMLRNTRKKVADVAVSVGYENTSYFHRLFTERFGVSPREYRVRWPESGT